MVIKAKYHGTCTKCGGSISQGESINWVRGSGASHVSCTHNTEIPSELTNVQYLTGYSSFGPCFADCGNRIEEFLTRAAEYNKISVDDVKKTLLAGQTVNYEYETDRGSWYIRDTAIFRAKLSIAEKRNSAERAKRNAEKPVMCCRSCGQTGNRGDYPFSTNPGSGLCDDCC